MTKKSDLLEFAEKNGWEYPRVWAWLTFSLIGGVIGGLLFGIFLMFAVLVDFTKKFNLFEMVRDILIIGIAGFFVGFLPASLTGIYVALRKITLTKYLDYLELFIVGGVITIVFGLSWLIYDNKDLKDFQFYVGAMILGGLTSMICGKLFLPKLDLEKVNLT